MNINYHRVYPLEAVAMLCHDCGQVIAKDRLDEARARAKTTGKPYMIILCPECVEDRDTR